MATRPEIAMRFMLSAMTILLCACSTGMQSDDPAVDVHFTVRPTTSAAGDSIVLTLHNGTDGQIGYNLCASSLTRRTGDSWMAVPSDVVCTMELRLLEGGQSANYRTAVPRGLSPGEYRYHTSIEVMQTNERHAISSSRFTVTS
jgi:hypothetical protein